MRESLAPARRASSGTPRQTSRAGSHATGLTPDDQDALYAFIGRVSLLLVAHNVDAITATMFLREIVDAGGQTLSLEQARHIASNYVEMVPGNP